ncbi:MAG: glutaredoxin family protein [Verrucomicrobiota bacterium]
MKVFTKTGCPWCLDAIAWLKENDYDFTEVNVSRDRAAFEEMHRLSGQTKAPTLVLEDGQVLADFGVAELKPFLASL